MGHPLMPSAVSSITLMLMQRLWCGRHVLPATLYDVPFGVAHVSELLTSICNGAGPIFG